MAVQLRNCPEFVFLTFALAKIGAVKVPINVQISRAELIHMLRQAEVSCLISCQPIDRELMEKIRQRETPEDTPGRSSVPGIRWLILMNRNPLYEEEGVIYWRELLGRGRRVRDDEAERYAAGYQDPQGMSDIIFTSGSTSQAKGVMVHHDMLLRSALGTCYSRRMEKGRRIFVPIPLFHMFAYVEGLLAALLVGGVVILPQSHYSARLALMMMQYCRANDIICVSSIMADLLNKGSFEPKDFPDLHAGYWASSCADWVWRTAREKLGIQDITTGYGMTECGSTTSLTRPEDGAYVAEECHGRPKYAGSAGDPRLGGRLLEIRICDPETGREVPYGGQGELYCRGLTVTKGYYNDPEANAGAFDGNGWFHTGDLARFEPGGNLVFLGRNSDMYKINGENVSPQYVDHVLGQCPGVLAAETVGIRHPKYGAVGIAFLDCGNENLSEMCVRLHGYCERYLARYQIPGYFVFGSSESWPKTRTGKVAKKKLGELAAELLARQADSQGADKRAAQAENFTVMKWSDR